MSDDTRLNEQQGLGFVKFLAGQFGCLYRDITQHDKGVDAEPELVGKISVQSPIIGVQVKARSKFQLTSDNEISITVTNQNLKY